MLSLPSWRRGSALLFLAAASLGAHPDHNATQRTDVPLIPATEDPPGPSQVSITVAGDQRVIVANGLPDHRTGEFPNAENPNSLRAQSYHFTVPARPVANAKAAILNNGPFGIAINGVLFDPGTAEYWHNDPGSGWHYDAKGDAFSLGLDANNGHVQPNGGYHYHGVPIALLARLTKGKPPAMTLLGWAADGFPIYALWGLRPAADGTSGLVTLKSSYHLKAGSRPTAGDQPGDAYDGSFVEDFEYVAGSGDLDECNGRTGVTPEFPAGTYYYVLTTDYPFIPRAFRGTPDRSFQRRGRPGRPPPGPPP